MKHFVSIILLMSWLCSCSESNNSCKLTLEQAYPEILQLMDSLDLQSNLAIDCRKIVQHDSLFFGQSETNSDGIFFRDSTKFNQLELHEFKLMDPASTQQIHKFVVFSFKQKAELQRFQNFCSSISRSLNHNKEIHAFHHYTDKTILSYKGFP